eukprot:4691909-Pleurochrysis_carterae.AAC.2
MEAACTLSRMFADIHAHTLAKPRLVGVHNPHRTCQMHARVHLRRERERDEAMTGEREAEREFAERVKGGSEGVSQAAKQPGSKGATRERETMNWVSETAVTEGVRAARHAGQRRSSSSATRARTRSRDGAHGRHATARAFADDRALRAHFLRDRLPRRSVCLPRGEHAKHESLAD